MLQFSLFGAAAATPTVEDLGGVLLAGGRWSRTAGTARLSVVVAERWRADGLAAEFAVLGLDCPDAVVPAAQGWSVRTAFEVRLAADAARWTRGANEGPPTDLVLTPGGLRLWAIAAGHRDEAGFLLGTAEHPAVHRAAGAQLARLGVTAASLGGRSRPGWRVTGVKRTRRLLEMIGPAPAGGTHHWPSS